MLDFSASISSLTLLLLVIVLSFIGVLLSSKLRVSYTIVLVALGFLLSLFRIEGGLGSIPLDRQTILGLVVPPLIFEAAMRTRYSVFRASRKTVLLLAIFGVIISAIVTGLALHYALGLSLDVALTFGVIVSPTDPVTIVGLLRRTKAPSKLTTILETEAYFNDATAVILYPIAVSLTFSPLQNPSGLRYEFR